MKNQLKFLQLALAVILIFISIPLASCNHNDFPEADTSEVEQSDKIVIQTEDYVIMRDENGCYMNFKNGNQKDEIQSGGCIIYTDDIEFKSLSDMKNALLEGTLTEDQLFTIRNFFPRRDDDSIIIIDPEEITSPSIPSDVRLWNAALNGASLSFYIRPKSNNSYTNFTGYFTHLSEEQYNTEIEWYNNVSRYDSEDSELISTIQDTERSATVYEYMTSTGTYKTIQYCITDGSTTLHIIEKYRITSNDHRGTSDSVPIELKICGSDDGIYFSVYSYNIDTRPSVEWLTSWGIE